MKNIEALWHLSPLGPIFLGAAALALALLARDVFSLLRGQINAEAFLGQIKKLLAAGNPDRARKLCGVVLETPVGVLVMSILTRMGSAHHASLEQVRTDANRLYADRTRFVLFARAAGAFATLAGAAVLVTGGEPVRTVAAIGTGAVALLLVLDFTGASRLRRDLDRVVAVEWPS